MIASLTGKFLVKTPSFVHLDVNGVGYEVQISLHTFSSIQDKKEGTLFTHLQIKEDAHVLFGFSELAEKELFIQLIGVNGVGASTARVMLSSMQPAELRSAIASGNTGALERIKGIGRKSAERIVLELREKIVKSVPESTSSGFKYNTLDQDALNALVALGIPRNVGETAIKKVKSSTTGEPDLETLIKKSLQLI